jgi:cellulose synthase/poly-beta-1,6-N-acetylglucosamine synthase-like glycosyltransferase
MADVLPFRTADAAPVERDAAPKARAFLGDILVRAGALAPDALEGALALQRGQDSLLGHILLVNGLISGDALVAALSEQSRLGRADLDATPPDPDLARGVDPYLCLKLEAIPWRRLAGRRVIAIANPACGVAAMEAFGAADEPVALAIAPAEAIRRAIVRQFGSRMVADAERRCPERYACRDMFAPGFGWRKTLALAGGAGAAAAAPALLAQAVVLWALAANLLTTALRLVALFARYRGGASVTQAATPRLVEWRRLPSVSLLVPLKREAAVAEQLLAALARMEYPAPLLDIKLVLEADDGATHAALVAAGLPPTVEIVTVPRGSIQTKPRAMNYALPFCRGEIVGVYDAEDLPDPGQIRAVVHHLMEAPASVGCVQGYLDFYNAGDNWLSRCFTIDYAVWFRIVLSGVQRLGLPIPLGGTTVFFRRAALEAVGGWDAHNVTEDADLGMRLARFGYRAEMIPTTTAEEANAASVRRWIGQRSRWLKGYAVTWAVHMRRPAALWRELGPAGFLGFQVILLGGVTAFLAAPVLWWLGLGALGLAPPLVAWPPAAMWAAFGSLLFGGAVTYAAAAVALVDAGRARLLPWLPSYVLYGPLGTIAAWRAVIELAHRPFHWQKTEHGPARSRAAQD